MNYKKWTPEDPFQTQKVKGKEKAVLGGTGDYYGACSIENFASVNSLSLTHEDAGGFLNYPTSFPGKAANFWFKDAGVKVWEYEETYDNWQDLYGMDAVMVFYHSGHGGMDANGVFQAPMGGYWDGRDRAYSNKMAFANERLRYLFWSTCLSLRVSGGQTPVKTWWNPNKGGLRMLFGYETTSVDNANYGTWFWDEWNKGKSFARAYLDASWRISHGQVPVVMAAGANQAEAVNRLNNERLFSQAPVSKGWYQWMWVGTIPSRALKYSTKIPKGTSALLLDNKLFDDDRISAIAKKVGVPQRNSGSILFDQYGNRMISSKLAQLNVNSEGALNINLGKPNFKNTTTIDEKKALKIAKEIISDLGFNKGIDLQQGNTRQKFTCGADTKGSGSVGKTEVVETIIQFRQQYDGVESINSDHGLLTISVDNDGKVTNIYNSTKVVTGISEKPKSGVADPKETTKSAGLTKEKQFEHKIRRIVSGSVGEGTKASGKANILNEKAGYDFSGNLGLPVYQQDVEIVLDKHFAKRFKIRIPHAE
jgi:hypothetical protein